MPPSSDSQHWPVICGTGHRRVTAAQYRWMDDELLRVIEKLVEHHGLETAVSGMALLFDQRYAELAKFSGLRLQAVVPFPGQADAWPMMAQEHWHEILRAADEVIMVSDTDPDPAYPKQAAAMLHQRNDRMLDMSQAVIALADPTKLKRGSGGRIVGGTWSAVEKAVRRGLPIIWLNPAAEKTTMPTPSAWARILSGGA